MVIRGSEVFIRVFYLNKKWGLILISVATSFLKSPRKWKKTPNEKIKNGNWWRSVWALVLILIESDHSNLRSVIFEKSSWYRKIAQKSKKSRLGLKKLCWSWKNLQDHKSYMIKKRQWLGWNIDRDLQKSTPEILKSEIVILIFENDHDHEKPQNPSFPTQHPEK